MWYKFSDFLDITLFIRITYKKHYFHYLISRSSSFVGLSTDLQIYASFEEAIRKYPVLHNQYTVSISLISLKSESKVDFL